MLKISTAPHLGSKITVPTIMQDVIIALMPALIVAIMFFGLDALTVILTSVASCVLVEYLISKYLLKTKNTILDKSAIITGLLLAYNLPCTMPIWMILLGSFIAIGVAKMAYGGLGKNLFNPALVGRVFLFISFPVQMTIWQNPSIFNFFNKDATTSATSLGIMKYLDANTSATQLTNSSEIPNYWEMFVGYTGGSLGEMSAVALLLGLAWLLYRKVITWHIPFYFMSTVFILTAIIWTFTQNSGHDPISHLLSGGLMLGAIFMATDYVTSPMSKKGQIIFAIGCGVLTVVIRLYSSYPEGVSFAILIMNAFVPLIDKFFYDRVYGTRK